MGTLAAGVTYTVVQAASSSGGDLAAHAAVLHSSGRSESWQSEEEEPASEYWRQRDEETNGFLLAEGRHPRYSGKSAQNEMGVSVVDPKIYLLGSGSDFSRNFVSDPIRSNFSLRRRKLHFKTKLKHRF